jgi:hypothetical protein
VPVCRLGREGAVAEMSKRREKLLKKIAALFNLMGSTRR